MNRFIHHISETSEPAPVEQPHPEFGLSEVSDIRLPEGWQLHDTLWNLETRIIRDANDLRSHMRRIWLYRDLGDSQGVAGAAIDLFIILGCKGEPLRLRVLETFQHELKEAGKMSLLSSSIHRGLDKHDPRTAHPQSVLAQPASGHFGYIRYLKNNLEDIGLRAGVAGAAKGQVPRRRSR